ncbi:holo-ACP synthase [Oceanobacillus sp. CAU 1775]
MVKGIGIDIVELYRIEESLSKGERFINRILTQKEKERFFELNNQRRRIEFIAGRFAAKEACAKALGTGIGRLSFQHIQVSNLESGAPILEVQGYEKDTFLLSISHSKEYAVAQVLIQ